MCRVRGCPDNRSPRGQPTQQMHLELKDNSMAFMWFLLIDTHKLFGSVNECIRNVCSSLQNKVYIKNKTYSGVYTYCAIAEHARQQCASLSGGDSRTSRVIWNDVTESLRCQSEGLMRRNEGDYANAFSFTYAG